MQEASTVPTEVTVAIWAGVALIVGAVGQVVVKVINKTGDAINARLDYVIKRSEHNTTKIENLTDCLNSTDAQYIIDYRLFEHGLIAKPTPHDAAKEADEDGEHTQDNTQHE